MQRHQFWIFIAIGLAFGMVMEVIKSAGPDQEKLERLARLQAIAKDEAPEYQPVLSRIKKKTLRIAGLSQENAPPVLEASAQAATPLTTQISDAKKAEDKKKKEAEEKKKKDAEKKKKEAEKKKKDAEKKKKKKKKIGGNKEDEKKSDEEEKKDESKPENPEDNVGAQGGVGAWGNDPSVNNGGRQTVQEWQNYLLSQPDFSRLSEFVRKYRSGQIKSDVFYPVIESLLADPRPEMRTLGVEALGATESPKSFAYLSAFIRSEKAGKPRTQAQVYVLAYRKIENLRHIASTLAKDDDPATLRQALIILTSAAELHLKNPQANPNVPGQNGSGQNGQGQPTDGMNPNGVPPGNVGVPPGQHPPGQPGIPGANGQQNGRTPASALIRHFDPFIQLLNRLAVTGTDPNLRQSATSTLSHLQNLIAMRST